MDRRIIDVLAILDQEWRRDHRVEDLATAVNLHASRLQHLFKEAVQQTIRDVILARRLDEAAKLIATTYERISEIAYFVGFRDISNFNHAFRRRFGIAPRDYRQARQESSASQRPVAAFIMSLQKEPNQNR